MALGDAAAWVQKLFGSLTLTNFDVYCKHYAGGKHSHAGDILYVLVSGAGDSLVRSIAGVA